MNIFFLDVNVVEEVVPHERVVAFWVINWQTYVFIHVESDYILERNFSLFVQLNQSFVHAEWR